VLDDTFRREWPRILAAVIRYTGSLELAEDAVQEAFTRAAASRERELLINPAAWITTVAKRIAIDTVRRDVRLRERLPLFAREETPARAELPTLDDSPGGDDRLGLLFVTCTPDLAP
jgi:RNA polymerase sigma-70 factor (ECF subfamily)